MQESDLEAGDRLVRFAGWNQVENDWRAWLELPRARVWVTEIEGRVVASASAVPYEQRFGWLGMVLVDPDFRRRGLAADLVSLALGYLERQGCRCQKLDATPEGYPLYEKFGFRPEYEVQRWRRPAEPGAGRLRLSSCVGLEPSDLPSLEELDRRAFGASRLGLLEVLAAVGSGFQIPACPGWKRSRGYGFVRPGRRAAQIGPLVTGEPAAAADLMEVLLRHSGGSDVIADLPTLNTAARELLARCGFSPFRRLVRMFRGQNQFPGRVEEVYCLAGFEWG